MLPYGGSPRCPRCTKAVYAAEQAMGPGRRLYHKSCLTCYECNKRLDSYSLVEHDEEPYCKNCHRKNFGTRDLRQANLPHRPLSPDSTGSFPHDAPLSPTRTGTAFGTGVTSPVRAVATGEPRAPFAAPDRAIPAASALLRPTRALSPTRATFAAQSRGFDAVMEGTETEGMGTGGGADGDAHAARAEDDSEVEEAEVARALQFPPGTPTHTGRTASGLPRSGQISPTRAHSPTKPVPAPPFDDDDGSGPVLATPESRPTPTVTMTLGRRTGAPLSQTPTGTRYGAALAGASPLRATPTGSPRWGTSNPICPRCQKSVFFAEQVKAVGKTWHKACLRCSECGTSLDATRLTEKDGMPHCHRCYNKLHGPAGQGYALLGKAGG